MYNSKSLSRRNFLKAIGAGAGVAAMSSILPSTAFASFNGRPQRFLIYFVPHGWPIEQVDTFGTGANWLTGNKILGSLAPWQDKVTVLRGITQTNNGGHGSVHHILGEGGHGKDTIDTYIGRHFNERPWVLSAASPSSSYFARINFENKSPTKDFSQPLDFVDQAFTSNPESPEVLRAKRYRNQLFSMSESNLEKLSNSLKGITREETRLSSHIEALRNVKARSEAGLISVDSGSISSLKARLENTRNLDGNNMQNTQPILDGHIDAIATAFITGAASVGTIRSHSTGGQPIGNFPGGPGVAGNPHMNSHNGNAQHRIDHYGKNLTWYIDRLAQLVQRLDVVDPLDPANTVLDNTTILYVSEFADGSHCTAAKNINVAGGTHYTYMPYVLIGGGAGKINAGGVVNQEASHYDVLQTLANIHGTEFKSGNVLRNVLA